MGYDSVDRMFTPAGIEGCDETITPLGSLGCVVIFDVNECVTLTRIESWVVDSGSVPVPAVTEIEEDDDESKE